VASYDAGGWQVTDERTGRPVGGATTAEIGGVPAGRVTVGICAIFKDEARDLPEWLAWHRQIGISRFFLYDNDSTDGSASCCTGADVTVTPWRGYSQQMAAYAHCLRSRPAVDWLAFIDLDEFLLDPAGRRIDTILPETTAQYQGERVERVWVPWRMFGWKPHEVRPAGGVLQNYLWRAHDASRLHAIEMQAGKSIVQPSAVVLVPPPTPHHLLVEGLTWSDSGLVLNHYWTKSKQEAFKKANQPRADNGLRRSWQQMLDLEWEMSAVYDDRIAQQARACGVVR